MVIKKKTYIGKAPVGSQSSTTR